MVAFSLFPQPHHKGGGSDVSPIAYMAWVTRDIGGAFIVACQQFTVRANRCRHAAFLTQGWITNDGTRYAYSAGVLRIDPNDRLGSDSEVSNRENLVRFSSSNGPSLRFFN